MDLKSNHTVERFVQTWQERAFVYEALALEIRKRCEDGLGDIKCILSHRAKSPASLTGSLIRQQASHGREFTSEREIVDTMVDLAGVRVALYFPDDLARVDRFIKGAFTQAQPPVVWGGSSKGSEFAAKTPSKGPRERLQSYRGTHYRVRLKPESKVPQVLLNRTVEIQVTSVMMHAWADVHHDLIYKPYAHEVTEEEGRILNLINTLAQAGDVVLQQLQISQQRKIAQRSRKFADPYELGVWLRDHAAHYLGSEMMQGCRLEQANVLLDVLRVWNLDSPERFRKILGRSLDEKPVSKRPEIQHQNFSTEKSSVDRFAIFLNQTGQRAVDIINDMEKNIAPEGIDLTVWALLRACHFARDPIQEGMPVATRLEAFVMINALSVTLTMSDKLPFTFDPLHTNDSHTVASYLFGHPESSSIESSIAELWWGIKPFRPATRDDDYKLWILGSLLSMRGITVLPDSAPKQAFLWPGMLGWPHRRIAIKFANLQQAKLKSPSPTAANPASRKRYYSEASARDVALDDRPSPDAQRLFFLRSPAEHWKPMKRRPRRSDPQWRYSAVSLDDVAVGTLWKGLLRSSATAALSPTATPAGTPTAAEFPRANENSIEYVKELEAKLAFVTGLLVEAEKSTMEIKLQLQRH